MLINCDNGLTFQILCCDPSGETLEHSRTTKFNPPSKQFLQEKHKKVKSGKSRYFPRYSKFSTLQKISLVLCFPLAIPNNPKTAIVGTCVIIFFLEAFLFSYSQPPTVNAHLTSRPRHHPKTHRMKRTSHFYSTSYTWHVYKFSCRKYMKI